MLGSYFDLKKEIARIAAQRAAEESKKQADDKTVVYSDFDNRLQDFVRSFHRAHHSAEAPAPRPTGGRASRAKPARSSGRRPAPKGA